MFPGSTQVSVLLGGLCASQGDRKGVRKHVSLPASGQARPSSLFTVPSKSRGRTKHQSGGNGRGSNWSRQSPDGSPGSTLTHPSPALQRTETCRTHTPYRPSLALGGKPSCSLQEPPALQPVCTQHSPFSHPGLWTAAPSEECSCQGCQDSRLHQSPVSGTAQQTY